MKAKWQKRFEYISMYILVFFVHFLSYLSLSLNFFPFKLPAG